ncbi:ribbon-helix-helix domain-containing protein [Kozakia baliensis]|uniref:Aryl-sulfate sulfotransferase n=1 Tax=Kozakia baliensis TaxID=153496 RepID=A0A1D8UV06_9PROT|nr:ribbon-helix-helix domain-containing protein [Kozakia baliensis]AOX17458.1 aryl-sulfate sulfotransferase [Kozakia baliensis]GBR30574.1 hypothetical protein AA0488_2036 [Kozakia baliensis NRIC 0488]GEL63085.1 hypothetical protein KBA01_03710 [Kozakia baliensis]
MTYLLKRSVSLSGHRTSVALEAEFWDILIQMAAPRPLAVLIAEIDANRAPERPLASALRLAALKAAQEKFS